MGFFLFMFGFLMLTTISASEDIRIRITVERANIRLKPDIKSTVIGKALLGDILIAKEKSGRWFKIVLPPDENGIQLTGFIHESIVDVLKAEPVEKEPEPPAVPPPSPPLEKKEKGGGLEFGLLIQGGGNMLLGNVINDHIEYWNDTWTDAVYINSASGEFKPIKWGGNIQGEVQMKLTPHIFIGLGAGYLAAQGNGSIRTESSLADYEDVINTGYRVVPILLNLYFRLPLSGKIGLWINAGGGYYLGKVTYEYSYDNLDGSSHYEDEWSSTSNTFGFQGGLNAEWKLSPFLSLVAGGGIRIASLKNLSGTYSYLSESSASTSSNSFTDVFLWSVEEEYMGNFYPTIIFDTEMPDSSSYRNIKKATFSLNDISLRIGILFHFSRTPSE